MKRTTRFRDPGDDDHALLRDRLDDARYARAVSPDAEQRRLELVGVLERQLAAFEDGDEAA